MEMSGNGKESSLPPVLPEEEDLPPGVRKHNRCHSSSSSESEDEADKEKQQTIDVDSSDSDSDKDNHDAPKQDDKKADSSEQVAADAKSGSKEKEISSKAGRSGSDSRSRSRSHSPSPKRRKSSEKSKRSRSRSRDRDRRHRRDRKHRSHRSRSKERRRSRDRHRHKKDRRRSRSRSRSRDRDRRDRRYRRSSRDKDRRRRSRSRDRRDSRSPSPHDGKVIKFGNKVIKPGASFGRPSSSSSSKPITFKEKMRQQLIKAIEEGADTNDVLVNKGGSTICTQSAGVLQQTVPKPKGPPVPLMDTIVPSTASLAALTVTASQAAMQSMLALQKEATEKTGVEIPKYYNPAAINPMKYAEQVQKRKLLWSKAKDKDVNSQWHATSLSGDADDKSKEKFRKLMGIKNDSTGDKEGEKEEKQKQLFDQLNKEYEFARMTTHTHRGIGLGFGSSSAYPPPQPQPQQQAPPSSLPPHSQQPPPSTS